VLGFGVGVVVAAGPGLVGSTRAGVVGAAVTTGKAT
jgi:hypothetical protein